MIQLLTQKRRNGNTTVTPPNSTGAPNPLDFTFTQLAQYAYDENPDVAIAETGLQKEFNNANAFAGITSLNLSGAGASMDAAGLITIGDGDNFLLTGQYLTSTYKGIELILAPNQANLGRIGLGVKKGNQYAAIMFDFASRLRHPVCHDGTAAFTPELVSDEHKTAADTSAVARMAMLFVQNFLRLRVVHANGITNDYLYAVSPDLIINDVTHDGQWEFVIFAGCNQAATVNVDRIKIGRPVSNSLQNHRSVQYNSGEPVVIGNEQYFSASCSWGGSSPGTMGSVREWSTIPSGLFSVNTITNAITCYGHNIVNRNGRFYSDTVVHVTLDKNTGLATAACGTHGNYEPGFGALQIVTLSDNPYSLSGSNVLGNQNTLNFEVSGRQGYDPSLIYAGGYWYCAFAASDDGHSTFFLSVYRSVDLNSWELWFEDNRGSRDEGSTIYKIGSTLYVFCTGPSGFRVYNLLTKTFLGTIEIPNPGVPLGQNTAEPHPCLLPFYTNGNTEYRLMTMGFENGLKQWYYKANQLWIGGNEWLNT